MSSMDQQFDSVLLSLARYCDDDVPQLIDLFFGFLARRTDFFAGQLPSQSRQEIVEAFQRQSDKLDEVMTKKRQDRLETEKKQEAWRKHQIELEKAKQEQLIQEKPAETVVLKTVGEYELENPKNPESEPQSNDENPDEVGDKENASDMPDEPVEAKQKPEKRQETPEEKAKREEEEVLERARFMPNSGNGCDLPNYKWTQTLEQLEINVPLRAGVALKARDVVVEMGKTTLKVGVRGRDPIIDGELFAEVLPNDENTTWMLIDKSVVSISLPKKKKTEFWNRLVKTDPEVSTKKMNSGPLNFTDLEEDHKMVVEKLMYDSRAKQMGLPTSEEKKKLDMIEKIRKINPNLNIDPSQIRMPGDQNSFSFQ